MTGTAIGLLLLGLVLAEPVSRALAAAHWPAADPVAALVLWQAVGLSGGLALVGSGLVYGLDPWGDSLPEAVHTLLTERPLPALGPWHLLALVASAGLAARLLGVLGWAVWRTLRSRRHHRDLLDLLATPWPAMTGARVLAHPVPVAYCLPGVRSRLVLSSGALEALSPDELAAVVAHERAHLRERHDLVVLPFVAWGATAPFVPGMVRAQAAVAALVEMRADDVARAETGEDALARALERVAGHRRDDLLPAFSAATTERALRTGPGRCVLPLGSRLAVFSSALGLVAVPTVSVLLGG